MAVAAVQVHHYSHLCTKNNRDWVAVQVRFNPGPGVARQTKAAITAKRTLGTVEKFGFLPPVFPVALLQQAIRENGLAGWEPSRPLGAHPFECPSRDPSHKVPQS